MRGQRFELNLESDDLLERGSEDDESQRFETGLADVKTSSSPITAIQEHEVDAVPPPPKIRETRTGFPAHRAPRVVSALRQQRLAQKQTPIDPASRNEPSDRAILHQVGKKYGYSSQDKEKQDISQENEQRLAQMSIEDIEEARAELMANFNPAFLEKLLKRANIDEDSQDEVHNAPDQDKPTVGDRDTEHSQSTAVEKSSVNLDLDHERNAAHKIHFPAPPRPPDEFKSLNPHSPAFLTELKEHYFPDTPHDPSSVAWLQDPSTEEVEDSPYNPEKTGYNASDLRFGFNGQLIPPRESLNIDVSKGLHHHGEAPNSAGYTVPELTILSRSVLPNQRCLAYQITGRILFRLGRGDFGSRGSELQEALWSIIERERIIEVMLSEANRSSGHVSAKTYAIEALWLWRKGGGGDRGLLKPSERKAI